MESYAAGRDQPGPARGDHRRQLRAHRRGARRPRGAGRGRQRAGAGPGPSSNADVDALARRADLDAGIGKGDRVGIWAPNCAGVDDHPVRHRQDRRDPGQHQPGLPHPRARLRAQPVRRAAADLRHRVQDQRLPRDGRRGASTRPRSRRSSTSTARTGPTTTSSDPGVTPGRSCSPEPARPGRPDQHPVHLRHHRLPQGRDAQPPQHPQQRLLHHRADQLHRARTGCASRCPSTTASGW